MLEGARRVVIARGGNFLAMQQPDDGAGPLTYQQFLDYAAARDGRFEYVEGHAVAMGIPSNAHQDLALALATAFSIHLRGQSCKVRLGARLLTAKNNERAPDVIVTCDARDLRNSDEPNRYPKLIVEILSPNRGDDLTEKVDEYRALATVEEYAIVNSRKRWVRLHRKNADGLFVVDADHIGGTVRLASIGFTLDIDALYDEVGVVNRV